MKTEKGSSQNDIGADPSANITHQRHVHQIPASRRRVPPGEPFIHPIIIYPFSHPKDTTDLEALYCQVRKWVSEKHCKEAVTVLNRQTYDRNRKSTKFRKFLDTIVDKDKSGCTKLIDSWSVDTCQMWLRGFGYVFDSRSSVDDVYWLIPGDFAYADPPIDDFYEKMHEIPEQVLTGDCELCLGEITVELNSSKQLIDTYGVYGLLFNWFPEQAQGIRRITDKPRTEFFAIGHDYLAQALSKRWYAYEQTLAILLQNMNGRKPVRQVKKIQLGNIPDDESGRDSLASAMTQVERTERMLKLVWRELNEPTDQNWPDKFRKLDAQSEQIRGAAMVILEQILRKS